jgi:hypothetical protein
VRDIGLAVGGILGALDGDPGINLTVGDSEGGIEGLDVGMKKEIAVGIVVGHEVRFAIGRKEGLADGVFSDGAKEVPILLRGEG